MKNKAYGRLRLEDGTVAIAVPFVDYCKTDDVLAERDRLLALVEIGHEIMPVNTEKQRQWAGSALQAINGAAP